MSVTTFAPETQARLAVARQVADAVLFEGDRLYPYRASAAKNRLRCSSARSSRPPGAPTARSTNSSTPNA